MTMCDQFRQAVEDSDHDGIMATLAEDVRLFSPVKFRPFDGKPAVAALFRVLLRTFQDFRYVGELSGRDQDGDGGPEVESHVLHFRTVVNGKQIEGIDLLHVGADGLISDITVMVRPLSAVTTLGEAILAGLVEDGVLPAPA